MILLNRISCKKCGDIIESKTLHDFKVCRCGAIFVDGGKGYLRRGGEEEDIDDLCEVVE